MLSDYDIDTAKVLVEAKRWVYVAFMCQQAIERQLKGMYVYHLDKEAPKSHNLGFLFEKIVSTGAFDGIEENDAFVRKKEECEDFLSEIMFFYMSDYPFSYRNIVNRFIDSATARNLLSRTDEWILWLRTLQPMPPKVDVEDLLKP
jgi:HEPN domain-containing protein